MTGLSIDAMRMACREKYACGSISPAKVMRNVEKTKATAPTITELASSVSSTLMATLPHKIVVNKRFESRLKVSIFAAAALPAPASASSRRRLRLKKARLSPENMAECARHTKIPIQITDSMFEPRC